MMGETYGNGPMCLDKSPTPYANSLYVRSSVVMQCHSPPFTSTSLSLVKRSQSLLSGVSLSVQYTVADVVHRPRNCCIGVLAVALIVFFSGSIMTGIWKAPYVLLRLAELNVGEVDIALSGGNSESVFINYSAIAPRFDLPQVRGVAPRWLLHAEARSCHNSMNMSQDFKTEKMDARVARINLLVIDSALERSIGIGRSWKHRDNSFAEAHVFRFLLEYLGIKPNHGDRMSIGITFQQLMLAFEGGGVTSSLHPKKFGKEEVGVASLILGSLPILMNFSSANPLDFLRALKIGISVRVADEIRETYGKYPSFLGNVVIMDYKHLLDTVPHNSCALGSGPVIFLNNITLPFWAALVRVFIGSGRVDPLDTVMVVNVVLNDRRSMYYKSLRPRSTDMVGRSNTIMRDAVGLDFNGSVEFPLAMAMDEFEMMKSILVSSLTCIMFGIVLLSSILLLMLLQMNADERQFEFSMMRAAGMQKMQLGMLFLAHALAFIIPGLLLGVILLVALNIFLEVVLAKFTHASPRIWEISAEPIMVALAFGVTMPLVVIYRPLSRSLSSNLRDALDVYHQVQNEAKMVMIKLDEVGLSTWQVILGILLVVGGFTAYYLLPCSFILENTSFFFFFLDIILVVMVCGMCLILCVAEPYVRSVMLWLLVWGRDMRLMTIIKKNMEDHQIRNSRAFMMLLVSIATLLSSGVMSFTLSSASGELAQIYSGADLVLSSSSFKVPLDEAQLDSFLYKWRNVSVQSWAYQSFPLDEYPQISKGTRLETLIRFGHMVSVVAVSETLFDTVFPEYIMEAERDKRYPYRHTVDGKRNVVQSMYEHPPKQLFSVGQSVATGLPNGNKVPNVTKKMMHVIPAITASAVRDVGVRIGDNMVLEYRYSIPGFLVATRFLVEIRALMDRLSGFPLVSSLVSTLGSSQLLVPRSYFETLLNPVEVDFDDESVTLIPGAVQEVRQSKLFVRFRTGIDMAARIAFVNAIQTNTDLMYHSITDTKVILDELEAISAFIMYFFYFTTAVCLFLCTLVVWVTFVANVQLNAHTLGVLCAVGCSKWQVGRVILYEALSIVLSAFALGLLVGLAVGLTFGLQFATLLILPFRFNVPYILILLLFALTVAAAVIGSLLPFLAVASKSIASVMKDV